MLSRRVLIDESMLLLLMYSDSDETEADEFYKGGPDLDWRTCVATSVQK